jgi:hypothetical protein
VLFERAAWFESSLRKAAAWAGMVRTQSGLHNDAN